jgi:hypothetical protein
MVYSLLRADGAAGLDPSLPIAPEAEPANVHSIEAARTRRATRDVIRRQGEL